MVERISGKQKNPINAPAKDIPLCNSGNPKVSLASPDREAMPTAERIRPIKPVK